MDCRSGRISLRPFLFSIPEQERENFMTGKGRIKFVLSFRVSLNYVGISSSRRSSVLVLVPLVLLEEEEEQEEAGGRQKGKGKPTVVDESSFAETRLHGFFP